MIEIVVVEHEKRGKFEAYIGGERVPIVVSNQPFYATARWLLAQGTDPETPIAMRHRNSPIVSMRSTVGRAAQLSVEEDRHHGPYVRRWRPLDLDRHGNPGAEPAGGDLGADGYPPSQEG
jgi:hypothetical protein